MVLYVREICADLGYDMSEPSEIFEDLPWGGNISCASADNVLAYHELN